MLNFDLLDKDERWRGRLYARDVILVQICSHQICTYNMSYTYGRCLHESHVNKIINICIIPVSSLHSHCMALQHVAPISRNSLLSTQFHKMYYRGFINVIVLFFAYNLANLLSLIGSWPTRRRAIDLQNNRRKDSRWIPDAFAIMAAGYCLHCTKHAGLLFTTLGTLYCLKGRSSPVWLAEKLSFRIVFQLLKASFV